jgi:hypothetical protein
MLTLSAEQQGTAAANGLTLVDGITSTFAAASVVSPGELGEAL